jgi:hypothetical protein
MPTVAIVDGVKSNSFIRITLHHTYTPELEMIRS